MNSIHWIVAVGIVAGVAGAGLAEEQHPRMFMTPARLAAIRQQATVKGSHHQLALAELQAAAAKAEEGDDDEGKYGPGYKAVRLAALCAVAEDPAEKKKYADAVYKTITGWTKTGSATLGKSMEAKCVALAYDWAYPVWTQEQRKTTHARLERVAAALEKVTHGNLGGDHASNFVPVIRGAEMLALLALGKDVKDERVQFLAGEMKTHMQNAWGDLGVSQEGGNYTEYPGGFLMPCILAMKELGDSAMFDAAMKHAQWKLTMYSRSFQPVYNHSLSWGVSHSSSHCDGWASFLLAVCPPDQLPYYLYFYDRHMGRLAVGPQLRFDSHRGSTVFALLFYPHEVTAKDPTGVFPPAVVDSRGYVFFRNRWKDADDVLGGIYAQNSKVGGWGAPEQLALNLLGFSSRFIGGPAKNKDVKLFSSLLIDGKYNWGDRDTKMGKVVAFEAGKSGAYAIVQGGQMFEKLGAKETVRHLLVEFLPDGGALLATLDRIKADTQHTYSWQINVGHEKSLDWMKKFAPGEPAVDAADNIKISSVSEAGRPSFLLQGRTGFAKGWAVAPADAELKAADPLQISAKATNTDILVVMLLSKDSAAAATIKGDGLGSSITVAGKTISFDAGTGRLVCK